MGKVLVMALVGLCGGLVFAREYVQEPVRGEVHASTVLPLGDGGYLAAWFGGTKEAHPDVAIWGARRIGGEWERPRVLAKVHPDSPHFNPVLRRADDGRISLYFKVGRNCSDWRTYLVESRDEGRSWSAPCELVAGDVWGGRGPVRNKCIRLKSGRWLAPASREFDPTNLNLKMLWRAFVDRSDDDGRTWTASPVFEMPDPKAGVIQPTLWVAADGRVRAYLRSTTGHVWETESADDGVTWASARETEVPNNNSGIDLVKASDGCLYLVLNTSSGNWASRSVLEVWRSSDDGARWTPWRVLEKEEKGEFSYPCIIEPRPGTLAVTYTSNRRRIAFAEMRTDSSDVPRALPGEDGDKAALPPDPFPDRISAYVWRNWGLVGVDRLARVVGATPEEIVEIARQMDLDPDPVVLPEWKTKGYITVLRRNWHLLPYDQILELLDMTRDELYFLLMEEDFLWVKLGYVKPKCGALYLGRTDVEDGRAARRRLASVLKEEGLDPKSPEEPRFAFVREIAAADPNWKAPPKGTSPFDFRLIFSYFANYVDPLGDPEIESFPEGLLQKLADQGVNAVWLHTVLRTLAKDPKYPEFGEGSANRIANLRKLVARCGKYGIRVYLYMNEPRAMPEAFFGKNAERQAMRGTTDGVQRTMCTSHPETLRWLRDALTQVFSQVPGLGGIFTITMSENLTNCASRGGRAGCPRCKGRAVGEIIAEVNAAMIEGMRRGDPNAEALVWNWAWPKDEEADIVTRLPKAGCRLMAVSENAMPICRGGVNEVENDYSISIVGPGGNAKRFWGFAREKGIPAVAKVQAGNSWELSSFPYIPTMDLVARHACNIAEEGVDGVMLSWSLGCCPSPNLGVYHDLRKGERTPDALLDRMAARLYGAENTAQVRKAWTAFSDGFSNYPFACHTIYVGPHHWGPANPLYLGKTGYSATMVGIPYDDLDNWRTKYPRETYAELIGKVADGFAEGCRLLDGVATKKELDLFRAEQMHFASCRDQSRFIMARDAGDADGMKRFAREELARAKAYWPLVRADSRIGFESSNQYYFIPRDVLEKVLSCRQALDR